LAASGNTPAGVDVMILKIFSPKNLSKKNWRFFLQNAASFCKSWIITLGFKKYANIFAENGQKSQKIVLITSTPAGADFMNQFRP
jgi:hypothetical protein